MSSKKHEKDPTVWKWWDKTDPPLEEGAVWNHLQHRGPMFPKKYKRLPRRIRFSYGGTYIRLSRAAEEMAVFYATELLKNQPDDVFNENFFNDWLEVMSHSEVNTIIHLDECNFSEIIGFIRDGGNKPNDEEKREMRRLEQIHGTCKVDDHELKVRNFRIDPPGLFKGRGLHPDRGKLKQRIRPEDVIINVEENIIVEPPNGHNWKDVLHDKTVYWLASWKCLPTRKIKYMTPDASSRFKGENDLKKFNIARNLQNHIEEIRQQYKNDFRSDDMVKKQLAVAIYLIDKLGIRAGNEKEQAAAATVGCCTLEVKNIKLYHEERKYMVELEFLGKDSVRFHKSFKSTKVAYTSLKSLTEGKHRRDAVFDSITPSTLNAYLNNMMTGLTCKVFRTFIASKKMEEELSKNTKEDMSEKRKIIGFKKANVQVALLLNHKKKPNPAYQRALNNLQDKYERTEYRLFNLEAEVISDEEKVRRYDRAEDRRALKLSEKKLQRTEEKLTEIKEEIKLKKKMKNVALETSKANYIDPRINVAWSKKFGVPLQKIYNKNERRKFLWAIETTTENFEFIRRN